MTQYLDPGKLNEPPDVWTCDACDQTYEEDGPVGRNHRNDYYTGEVTYCDNCAAGS